MKIYKLYLNESLGYDSYDSCVVVAKNGNEARKIHPSRYVTHHKDGKWMGTYSGGNKKGQEYENNTGGDWLSYQYIDKINVICVGFAGKQFKQGDVICASFNAG